MSEPAPLAESASTGTPGCAPTDGPADGRPSPTLSLRSRPHGHRVLVTVRGDLELGTDDQLRRGLRDSLARSAEGIDLDLAGVGFCDCSGLNALLSIRQEAMEHAKTATIRSISPAAQRVFSLTDTLSLFSPPGPPEGPDTDGVDAYGVDAADLHPAADGRRGTGVTTSPHRGPDPRVEVVQLRRALETRDTIDLARGILMAAFALSPVEAWNALVRTSQNTNTKLHRTARQLVESCTGAPVPPCTREQLSAAVTEVVAERTERAPSAD
ncbi:ANTAR domain-containing protein [Streptomyces sp. LBUM 1478]|uniref:Anti-sigma factor antagonist n=1 Tax=Streptomyces scabiei (strain 87.22) TaxID=680198 RepID=C9ZHJ3_STRSW|nr:MULTISPECIES: ANTAR domain-containing protein [Streptomyces]MBP5872174.1 ANTAR domain-containing protein [Streptomyces sp. LBUM 1485]MBP5910568.1 ANTAR domain-containing protein [Streptomyces sp. LBUM 1478]MBP5918585.1 ANTAR domain-containing protein [Streptomyces sp. LBUM 1486]MDX2538947.1 ANTAR domain-containing protein [Streptomyces scabiei]MDX2579150.1 ANTAR domain-containing protein [Streptomyces scabiei]